MLQGQDSPSAAAITPGPGERLLGMVLVGNAILRLGGGGGREKAVYVKSEPRVNPTRHNRPGLTAMCLKCFGPFRPPNEPVLKHIGGFSF